MGIPIPKSHLHQTLLGGQKGPTTDGDQIAMKVGSCTTP